MWIHNITTERVKQATLDAHPGEYQPRVKAVWSSSRAWRYYTTSYDYNACVKSPVTSYICRTFKRCDVYTWVWGSASAQLLQYNYWKEVLGFPAPNGSYPTWSRLTGKGVNLDKRASFLSQRKTKMSSKAPTSLTYMNKPWVRCLHQHTSARGFVFCFMFFRGKVYCCRSPEWCLLSNTTS